MISAMLTGCGSKEATATTVESETTEISEVTEEEQTDATEEAMTVLKVGMEIGYPPFEYFDTDGTTPIGVDVELANAIAAEIGVELEIVDTAWDGIFAGLDKGDYDCIISAVTITPERLLSFDFSNPYIQNYQCIVTLKDAAVKPTDPSMVTGLKVAYQEETTSDIYITDYATAEGIEFEPFEYAKVIDCYSDLQNGRVDAIICDSTVASSYLGEGTIFEQTWIQDSEPEEFGVCMKRGNVKLFEKINTAIEALKANGTLDNILDTYF